MRLLVVLLAACGGPSGSSKTTPSSSSSSLSPTPSDTGTDSDSAWWVDTGGAQLPGVTTWDTADVGTEDSGVGTACAPEPEPWLDTGDWPSTRDTGLAVLPDDHDGDGVVAGVDCDDHDPMVYPGAAERCDGVDTDCDPLTGEDGLVTLAGTITTSTIQAAIDQAVDGDTILVCPGTYEEVLDIDGTSLRLVGLGGPEVTVLTSPTVVNDTNGVAIHHADVALAGLTVEGFDLRFTAYLFPVLPGAGVAVGPCASGVLRRMVVRDNKGAQYGGGVGLEEDGELWVFDSEVSGNTVLAGGGGVAARAAGHVVLRDVTIADNASDQNGGGLLMSGGHLELERVVLSGNTATDGAGLSVWSTYVDGDDVSVLDNVATGDGGGLELERATVDGSGWMVTGNVAGRGGGAYVGPDRDTANGQSTVTFDATSVFASNDASTGGGVASGYVEWTGGELSDNTAEEGGAIAAIGGPSCFHDLLLQGNTAERGGAVALGEATLHLVDSEVSDSLATDVGDAAWLPDTVGLGLYSVGTTWDGATAYPVGLGAPAAMGLTTTCNPLLCTDELVNDGWVVDELPAADALPHPQGVVASDRHVVVGDPEVGQAVAWHHDGTTWQLLGPIDTPHRYDAYGYAMALDGDTLVVGASAAEVDGLREVGSVWVFTFDGTQWEEQVRLSPAGSAEEYGFGGSVALTADQLFVGAAGYPLAGNVGGVYVFDRAATGVWPLVQVLSNPSPGPDYFGGVVVDGDTLVVSAAYDDDPGPNASGSVYVYERGASDWSLSETLRAATPTDYGRYGQATAIDDDRIAVMGAEGVEVWERTGATGTGAGWQRQATLPDASEGGLALQGTRLFAGEPLRDNFGVATGAMYVYDLVGGVWSEPTVVAPTQRHMSDRFAIELALVDDEHGVAIAPAGIAGPREGRVFWFEAR